MDLFEFYDKRERLIIKILATLFIALVIYNHVSFDETVLKNVDMEPFSEPIQNKIIDGKPFKQKVPDGIATITPLADYKIYGRVYAKHFRPSKLPVAAIYPYDVSIGFGDFKYKDVYKSIKVRMASTVAYTSYSGFAYKKHLKNYFKDKSINHCFTNNHLCPANNNVKKGISKLKKKDIVYIEGFLIKFNLVRSNGIIEKGISSTARNDKEKSFRGNNGYGSCEQIYVTRVVSRHGDYE